MTITGNPGTSRSEPLMTIRSTLTPAERQQFPVGAAVRYKPGVGVYGFEDCVEADGRLPGVVLGYTDTRVRLELTLNLMRGRTVRRSVNAASLIVAPRGTPDTVGSVGVSDPVAP
jgi:hypothetical protein